jgi:hypothetical protein
MVSERRSFGVCDTFLRKVRIGRTFGKIAPRFQAISGTLGFVNVSLYWVLRLTATRSERRQSAGMKSRGGLHTYKAPDAG